MFHPTFSSTRPLDFIFVDIWFPRHIPSKYRNVKLLASMEELAGFVDSSPLLDESSVIADCEFFLRFFVPNGLPSLVVVDTESTFAGLVSAVCKKICVPLISVSLGNYRAVRVEWLFYYLKKVDKVVCADA